MTSYAWSAGGVEYEVRSDGEVAFLFVDGKELYGAGVRTPHGQERTELLSLAEKWQAAEERAAEGGWIPVGERLPEEDQVQSQSRWVLVWCAADGVRWCSIACRVAAPWQWELRSGGCRPEITHWRELPEGPA